MDLCFSDHLTDRPKPSRASRHPRLHPSQKIPAYQILIIGNARPIQSALNTRGFPSMKLNRKGAPAGSPAKKISSPKTPSIPTSSTCMTYLHLLPQLVRQLPLLRRKLPRLHVPHSKPRWHTLPRLVPLLRCRFYPRPHLSQAEPSSESAPLRPKQRLVSKLDVLLRRPTSGRQKASSHAANSPSTNASPGAKAKTSPGPINSRKIQLLHQHQTPPSASSARHKDPIFTRDSARTTSKKSKPTDRPPSPGTDGYGCTNEWRLNLWHDHGHFGPTKNPPPSRSRTCRSMAA